jgi:hypothetical protein
VSAAKQNHIRIGGSVSIFAHRQFDRTRASPGRYDISMRAALLCLLATLLYSETGVERLYRLDLLPVFHESVSVASRSSYDRTGRNDDGFSGKYSFVRKEGDGLIIRRRGPV